MTEPRNPILHRLCALVGLAAIGIAGCSGSGSTEQGTTRTDLLREAVLGPSDPMELEAAYQQAISVCMRQKGWEHQPIVPTEEYADFINPSLADEREWAARYGSSSLFSSLFPEDARLDRLKTSNALPNPNEAYEASLSPEDQQAYSAALHGSREEQDAAATWVENPETGKLEQEAGLTGCVGEARKQTYLQQEDHPEQFSLLERLRSEVSERIAADPRVVEADRTYVSCMNDKGYPGADPNEIWSSLQRYDVQLVEEIGRNPWAIGQPGSAPALLPEELEALRQTLSVDELNERLRPALSPAELETALKYLELSRTAALDELDCGQARRAVHNSVMDEHEAQVLEENQSEVAAVALALGDK